MMKRTIKTAEEPDVPCIMAIIDAARQTMHEAGNTAQWPRGYPSAETLKNDVRSGFGFIVEDDETPVAYFALRPSPEPTYSKISDGEWLDNSQHYHVIHRIASIPGAHGIFSTVIEFCFSRSQNIRIDTHRDNHIMRHVLQKHGFAYCGIIHVASGDERLAYQKVVRKSEEKDMNIVVRKYETDDLDSMIAVWNEIVEAGDAFPQEEPLTRESGAAFFASQTHVGVAVDEDDGIVGLYILHPNNVGRCGHIANASYAVRSNCRGRHIGEKLVLDCLAQAKAHGFGILQFNAVVEGNVHARHLYERLGFSQLGTIPRGFRMKDGTFANICPYYRETNVESKQ